MHTLEQYLTFPTANLLLIKIFLNSVISTKGAKFANADLANFYLMTPLKRPEYAKIKMSDIPEEVIKEYNLHQYATPDSWVYIKVSRGMYGLPQAGSLGHDLLEQRLNKEGYFQSQIVPALWKHKTKPIQFVLVVDNFGIKYLKKEDLDHLIQMLKKHYDVSVHLEGKEFMKIQLDQWRLTFRKLCDISTTSFLANAKIRLIHTQNQNTVQNSNSLNMTRVRQSETMSKSIFSK